MQSLDMGDVTTPIDELTTAYTGLFQQTGQIEFQAIVVVVLVIYAIKHGLTGGLLLFLLQYVPLVLVVANLLKYYQAPLPFAPFSVHQAFSVIATDLANQIDIKRMDILFQRIGALLYGIQKPGITDFVMLPVYWMVEIDMWFLEFALFAVTGIGFIALGIGSLIGPILIPWLIVPRLSWLFWGWIQYMLQYSFYRVIAAGLVFICSTIMTGFIDRAVHGDYSLAHFSALMPRIIVLTLLVLWACLTKPHSITSDLFKGSSSAGASPRVRILG